MASLLATSNLILSNLVVLGETPVIGELIVFLEGSSIEHQKPVFEKAVEFLKTHGKYPSKAFLAENFKGLFEPVEGECDLDSALDFMTALKVESFQAKASAAIQLGKFGDVEVMLQGLASTAGKKRFTIDDSLVEYDRMLGRPSGVLLGIPEIDTVLNGICFGNPTIIAAPPSMFKCQPGDTLVHTSRGYLRLDKLVEHGEGFQEVEGLTVLGGEKVSHTYNGGLSDVIEVGSEKFSLKGTPEHPILVFKDGFHWKRLSEIEVGDWVCMDKSRKVLFSNQTPIFKGTEMLEEFDKGWVLGMLLGDGNVSGGRVAFCGSAEVIGKVQGFLGAGKVYEDKRRENLYNLHYDDTEMAKSWSELRGNSSTKRMPDWFLTSNEEFIRGVVAGYYDADGSLENWRLTTNSKELAYGSRNLLNLLGLFPTIKRSRKAYLVMVDREQLSGFDLRSKLGKKPRSWKRSGERFPWSKELQDLFQYKTPRMNREQLRANRKSLDILNRGSRKLRNQRQYEAYKAKLGSVAVLEELFGRYHLSQVTVKRDAGRVAVYDLSVPTTHAFMANGVISHNTTTAVSIVYNAVFRLGFNFAFITFEIMKRDMWFNLLSRHSKEMGLNIPAEKMKKFLLTEDERMQLGEVVEDWKKNCKGKIEILEATDLDSMSPSSLYQTFHKLDNEMGGLDGFVLDYIQRCASKCPPKEEATAFLNNTVQALSNLTVSFKGRGLIGIVLSQINRKGELILRKTKRGNLTMLAELNSLERDGHNIVFTFSDEAMRLNHTVMMQVVKNRSGKVMEEMASVFVEPEFFMVGAVDFAGIFTGATADLLAGASEDLFS